MATRWQTISCIVVLSLVLAGPANAREREALSLGQAVALVQERVGGRVLAAQAVQTDHGAYYEIRVLVRPGHVRVLRVDPRSGRIR